MWGGVKERVVCFVLNIKRIERVELYSKVQGTRY